jgi:hypothetical protein
MVRGGFVYSWRNQSLSKPSTRIVEQGQGDIVTASVESLALSSPEWFVEDAQRRLTRTNLFKPYCWTAVSIVLVALLSAFPLGLVLALLFGGLGILVQRWDLEQRTPRIIYDTSNPEIAERLAMVVGAAQWLGTCSSLWHIFHAVQTSDWKRNAGAGTLIRRTPTSCGEGALPQFELNIGTWCVPVGPQQLLFLPDRLLVWDGMRLAALPYEHITARASKTRFIEETGGLPPDGTQVGATWRFVCRDGSPDLRFSNNAKLAIMEYGELEIRSHGGLTVVLQTSTTRAAEGAARALEALAGRARPFVASHAPVAAQTVPAVPAGVPTPRPPRTETVEVMRARSVAILMKSIAAADRRIDSDEVAYASGVLDQLLPASHPELENLRTAFRALPTSEDIVSEALKIIGEAGTDYGRWVVDVLHRMANADGKVTPKEAERLSEYRLSLGV